MLVAVLLPAGTIVYVYLFKMVSFMQSRLGPMEAGPHGSLQLFAEVGKFLQKEDLRPDRADRFIFGIAPDRRPHVSTFLIFSSSRSGPTRCSPTLDVGIFYALAVSSLSVLGILMAGWASANKYSLIGGLRAAGQLIAYELPMVLAVVGVVIQAGTLNLQQIVDAQADGEIFGFGGIGNPYVLTQFVGFVIFLIAAQAELTQTPFDMPVAESELVAGYMTEYSGFRFLLFFIASSPPPSRSPPSPPRCSSAAGACPVIEHRQRRDELHRPARALRQDHDRRLPHLLGPLHLPPLP